MSTAIDRSRPPEAGAPRPFAFPEFERRRLRNGLELWLAPVDRLPLVDLQLVLDAGAVHDPESAPGLANFTAAVLDEGTKKRDSRQIAETVERLGGYLATGAGWDSLEIGCGLLARHLDTGLELVAEIARKPSFPGDETERLRGQIVAEIERLENQPAALAGRHLMASIYGDTPYGRPRIGTAQTVGAISRQELVAFYRRYGAPARAAFLLSGDFDPAAAGRRLEELLGDWPAQAAAPETAEPEAPAPGGRAITVVDRPGAQTELRLGHAGPSRSHPDFLPATVLNAVLGGKFMSRINLNLRERHGYTYGASSFFDWRRGPGPFVVAAAVATEHAGAAAREILTEIERLRREPVDEDELEETRNFLVGVFPYSTQKLSGITARLRQMAVHQLPDDFYRRWPAAVAAVGTGDVLHCARTLLHPESVQVVAVGPAEELAGDLDDLGPVRITAPAPAAAP